LKIEDSNITLKNVSFPNKDNNQILSFFKISHQFPCILPGEKEWVYNYQLQSSKFCKSVILGNLFDDRYKELPGIQTTKYKLYKENGINDEYNDPALENEVLHLYARSFLGFTEKYNNNFSSENLHSYQKISNRCGQGMKTLSIIFFCILGVSISGLIGSASGGKIDCQVCEIALCIIFIIIVISLISIFLTDIVLSIIIFVYS